MKKLLYFFLFSISILGNIIEKQNEYNEWIIYEENIEDSQLIFSQYENEKNSIRFIYSGQNLMDSFETFTKLWKQSTLDKSNYKYFLISYPDQYDDTNKAYIKKYKELTGSNTRKNLYDIYMAQYSSNIPTEEIRKENFDKLNQIKNLALKENEIYSKFFSFLEENGYKIIEISTEKHGFVEDNVYMPFMVFYTLTYYQ